MSRRDALRTLTAGGIVSIAGCAGVVGRTETPPSNATAAVTVKEVREFGPTTPLSANVAVVREWFTESRPPLLTVEIRNEGSESFRVIAGGGDRPVVPGLVSEESNPSAVIPTASVEDPVESGVVRDADAPSGCWRLDDVVGFYLQPRRSSVLAPQASDSLRVELWGYDEAGEICIPTGRFTFTAGYRVDSSNTPPAFTWGFEIRVDRVS